ncbi:MAG: class I SAM-dependent methyltransferase [Chitinophagaceae bacterium]|nr:class I SAM-dependent methyltransferase [Anaerolineae bacterium]
MLKSFLRLLAGLFRRLRGHLVLIFLGPVMAVSRYNFRLWLQHGYYIRPIHFYEPIPDIRELEKSYPGRSPVSGVDLRPDFQLQLLKDTFPLFKPEYGALRLQADPTNPKTFYLNNFTFTGVDPHVYYCMIRHFNPATIIEVGAGFSTMLAAEALNKNQSGQLLSIEPYPNEVIASGIPGVEHIRRKGEEVELDFYLRLKANDILFIDSSHVVKIGSDVCYFVLEVLPRLAPGVIIHFHDIFLPFNYPKTFVMEKHHFWNEQYLLHAYLIDNPHIETLFAVNMMCIDQPEAIKTAFPHASNWAGGSLWLRKL